MSKDCPYFETEEEIANCEFRKISQGRQCVVCGTKRPTLSLMADLPDVETVEFPLGSEQQLTLEELVKRGVKPDEFNEEYPESPDVSIRKMYQDKKGHKS